MQPVTNRLRLDAMLGSAPAADLYVLPEMFPTGFVVEPKNVAETDGETLEWMRKKAQEMDAAIAGSVAICEQGEKPVYRNRLYFVRPDGSEDHYDKRHLFSYGHENKHYTRGERRVVTEWRGVRILLQVCYDLRFPVFSRNHNDYDMAIYVASWPVNRRLSWDTLLRARAIENQCFVVGVNRVGSDQQCTYDGGTAIIDAYGRTMDACMDSQEGFATAELDMEWLQHYWEKFPVLGDADPWNSAV
jgi:predicted amidohydrolase